VQTYKDQTGAALIMLIGITAVLALLSATLVFAIQNQQSATAHERRNTQSFYAAEAALDTGVQLAKVDRKMSTTEEWLTQEDLEAAFYGFFPADATVVYRVYDNLSTVDYNIKWDQGGPSDSYTPDQLVWVEATVTTPATNGSTTRTRCLIKQTQVPFAEALPKAVTYSDTGIRLSNSSDIYAVDEDGNPDTSGPPFQTWITAGGTWLPTMSSSRAEVGRFTTNGTTDLAAPGTSTQSLGIKVNGSVSMAGTVFNGPLDAGETSAGGRTFEDVTIAPGTVGFLSDYFDQAAQNSLAEESQAGETPAASPSAPAGWSSSGFTTINNTLRNTLQSTTSTTTYNATANLYRSGDLTLSRGTNTTGRVFNFQRLYVSGNLTLTGPVTVNCTDLYVGGTLTINNATTTTVTDEFGPLYVAGTGASSASGRVNINAPSAYFGGSFTRSNSTPTAVTDNYGALYCVGALSVSGNVETNGSTLYGGGTISLTGHSSGIKTHSYALVYANSTGHTTTLSGNVQLYSSETTLNGNFTISGATTAVKNWLGHLYVQARPFASPSTGSINWSGRASVTSRDWQAPDDDPKPMWMGEYWKRDGIYDDEYGPTWVPGNSSTSVVFDADAFSRIKCPLLCTTEKNTWSGPVEYGTRDEPMVFFFMCDNNGIYPQVVEYSGTERYYGLMVINESTIEITNGSSTKPSVQGAIFAGCPYDPTYTSGMSMSDIVLEGNSSIAYDQYVVGKIATSSLKTTTTITQIVPGSWQQLPVN
jgi:hypothetical protein